MADAGTDRDLDSGDHEDLGHDRSPSPERSPSHLSGPREGGVEFRDEHRTCRECGTIFVWSVDEQRFYQAKGLTNPPTRCPECRRRKKAVYGDRFNPYDRSRELTNVRCEACGKECQVPFRPTQGRPVYCNNCYPSHRNVAQLPPAPGGGSDYYNGPPGADRDRDRDRDRYERERYERERYERERYERERYERERYERERYEKERERYERDRVRGRFEESRARTYEDRGVGKYEERPRGYGGYDERARFEEVSRGGDRRDARGYGDRGTRGYEERGMDSRSRYEERSRGYEDAHYVRYDERPRGGGPYDERRAPQLPEGYDDHRPRYHGAPAPSAYAYAPPPPPAPAAPLYDPRYPPSGYYDRR